MCKFKQIYKNVPGIGFFVKASRRFAKRMEPNKFVDTNLLINVDPLKIGNAFASRMVTDGLRSNGYSRTKKIDDSTNFGFILLQFGGKMQ